MAQIIGIRDGHRIITVVTGPVGALAVSRSHHPDCPCQTADNRPARIARRRKPSHR